MTNPDLIELRSDTFTRPCAGMYEAIAKAPVGDDVYGEDETINTLETKAATLLGKPAGLFLSSATQANLIAVLVHCARGEEVLVGDNYHISIDEAGGVSVLGSVVLAPLATDGHGGLAVDQVRAAIKPDDFHCPITRLLSLENTVSGRVQALDDHVALTGLAREHGLSTHLDGARIMNASIASGHSAAELSAPFDSVMLCLSKGLGSPVGALLCGNQEFITKARRLRKMLGGGMRQAGIIAACGIYALDNNVERLADDHANAAALADGLQGIEGLRVDSETNMVFLTPAPNDGKALHDALAKQNIHVGAATPAMRLVIHLDISRNDIDRVVSAVRNFYKV